MGRESHFTAKKPRVFVRGIQGHYNLKGELARLRSMPRVSSGAASSSSTTARRRSVSISSSLSMD